MLKTMYSVFYILKVDEIILIIIIKSYLNKVTMIFKLVKGDGGLAC